MTKPTDATDTLAISREVFVPREIIFELWTDAAHLMYWYPPATSTQPAAQLEPSAGGHYTASWVGASGEPESESGSYVDIDPPEHLVFTSHEGSVVVDCRLRAEHGVTRIDLELTGVMSAPFKQQLDATWRARLRGLEEYLSAI